MQSATAKALSDAQADYLNDPPYEAPYSSMLDFTRQGEQLGEEAFLTLDEDEREHFIEAACEGEATLAARVMTAAAWDEIARLQAASVRRAA